MAAMAMPGRRVPPVLLPLLAAVATAAVILAGRPADPTTAAGDLLARARVLHREVPLIDGHNDYPWEVRQKAAQDLAKLDISGAQPATHTDIPRLREGGVGAQFWSVYVPADYAGERAVTATLEQIDIVHRLIRRYPETFELAFTADDVERIFEAGRIASLIGMEGGHSIDSSLGALRMFYRLGARYMTLTHSRNVPWADSATDAPRVGGLSRFGEEVVREMNWLGMLVDLSHVSPATMEAVIRVSQAPVIFSHSSARALVDVPRNVPDAVLKLLPDNGGVAMVTFVPQFVSAEVAAHKEGGETPRATLSEVADHIDHVRRVAGIDHVGIGSDFDGITTVPVGLEDVSTFPALTAELLRRGYGDDDVKKVLGLNVLRVMRAAERVAARLQTERPPSAALIEHLDGAR